MGTRSAAAPSRRVGVVSASAVDARAGRSPRFVFVGERRSRRAIDLGAHWTDGRLCARTLHEALHCAGIDPASAAFVNLYHDEPADRAPCANTVEAVRSLAAAGACIVALGRQVQAALAGAGVAHVALVHPAARGAIRARAAYRRHVAEVLGRRCAPPRPDSAGTAEQVAMAAAHGGEVSARRHSP